MLFYVGLLFSRESLVLALNLKLLKCFSHLDVCIFSLDLFISSKKVKKRRIKTHTLSTLSHSRLVIADINQKEGISPIPLVSPF